MSKRFSWLALLLLAVGVGGFWQFHRAFIKQSGVTQSASDPASVTKLAEQSNQTASEQVDNQDIHSLPEVGTNGLSTVRSMNASKVEEGPHPFEGLRATAAELVREGKLDEAIRILQSIVETAGPGFDRASASRMLGTYALRKGDEGAAIQWLESAVDEYLKLHDGDFLAVPTLNLLAGLYLGKDNARALELFRIAVVGSAKGAPESDAITAMGGAASALQLLARPQEEAAAIRRLIERFPEYGKGDNGGRAIRMLRLAEVEHLAGSDGRLAAIESISEESWLQHHEAKCLVDEAMVREYIHRGDYSDAVRVAVRATKDVSADAEGTLSDSMEQLLNVIVDYPKIADAADVNNALLVIARRSAFPERRQAALDRLARAN